MEQSRIFSYAGRKRWAETQLLDRPQDSRQRDRVQQKKKPQDGGGACAGVGAGVAAADTPAGDWRPGRPGAAARGQRVSRPAAPPCAVLQHPPRLASRQLLLHSPNRQRRRAGRRACGSSAGRRCSQPAATQQHRLRRCAARPGRCARHQGQRQPAMHGPSPALAASLGTRGQVGTCGAPRGWSWHGSLGTQAMHAGGCGGGRAGWDVAGSSPPHAGPGQRQRGCRCALGICAGPLRPSLGSHMVTKLPASHTSIACSACTSLPLWHPPSPRHSFPVCDPVRRTLSSSPCLTVPPLTPRHPKHQLCSPPAASGRTARDGIGGTVWHRRQAAADAACP